MSRHTSYRYRARGGRSATLLLLAFVIVVVAGVVNWVRTGTENVPATVKLEMLSGTARISRADAGVDPALQAVESTTLQTGDQVRTDDAGRARLTFASGGTTELGGGTRIELLGLTESLVPRSSTVSLALEAGETLTRARAGVLGTTSVRIETRVATVEVLGAVFQCDAPTKNETFVAVYDGVVTLSMGEQSLELRAGQGARARLGAELTTFVLTDTHPVTSSRTSEPAAAPDRSSTPRPTGTLSFPLIVTPTRPGDVAKQRAIYTVQEGDTLSSISEEFGLPWQLIWEANRANLASPELIRAGQKLVIPEP